MDMFVSTLDPQEPVRMIIVAATIGDIVFATDGTLYRLFDADDKDGCRYAEQLVAVSPGVCARAAVRQ